MNDCSQKDCHVAEDAAHKASDEAVKKVFAILGVNIDIPWEVEEFRKDLRFGGDLRRFVHESTMKMFFVVVGAVVLGAVYTLWEGIKAKVGG